MRIETFRARLRDLGAQPLHVDRVLRDWVRVMDHDRGRRRPDDFLPKPVRAALPQLDAELDGLARVLSTHPADDGSARLLVGLGLVHVHRKDPHDRFGDLVLDGKSILDVAVVALGPAMGAGDGVD